MKKNFSIMFILFISSVIFIGCESSVKVKSSVPGGYEGVYVLNVWKGDNSIFPVNITGLVFKRSGNSYTIMLSNIDKGKAEEIEELNFSYKDGEFIIEFSSLSTIKIKPDRTGFAGTMTVSGKTDMLHLKKIK